MSKIFQYFVFAVILAALVIRVVGVNPGFTPYHPDEGRSYITAIHMLSHSLKPDYFDYPTGVPLLHLLVYKIFILPVVLVRLYFFRPQMWLVTISHGNRFLQEYSESIFGQGKINAMYWSRYIAAVIGALTVFLVYLVGQKLFNKRVALFSALFLAFNHRHVLGSHFGLPDVHNGFFSLLSFLTAFFLLEKNTRGRYLVAGAAAGLAFSIKFQPFSFLPFLVVHLIWVIRKRSWQYLFSTHFLKAVALIPLVFLILNPYFFFNLDKAMEQNHYTALRYQMGHLRLRLYPYFYLYHWGIGPMVSLAIVFGMFLMLVLAPLNFFLLASFVVPFFFVMTFYSSGGLYPRNFTTIMPMLVIFAGFFVDIFYQALKKIRALPAGILITILLFWLNFSSIKNSLILSYHYAQPWNLTKLASWLEEKMPEGIKLRAYHLYISPDKNKKFNLSRWDYSKGPHSLAEFQEEGTEFAILTTDQFDSITWWWRQWPNYMFLKYNQVPFDYITSSFYGLSIKELLQYTVGEIYKPWQAARAGNYLIFKIPPKPQEIGKRIALFNFGDQNQMWLTRSTFGFEAPKFLWDGKEGKTRTGALAIMVGYGTNTARLSSLPISIKPGKLYTVRGWIKNSPAQNEEVRDGFLRIDFYKDKGESELESGGLAVAVSPRAVVTEEWLKEETSLVAPAEANFLTVSFQREDSRDFSSYLDDVEVFESDVLPEEPFPKLPYIKPSIPLESIFDNSFL